MAFKMLEVDFTVGKTELRFEDEVTGSRLAEDSIVDALVTEKVSVIVVVTEDEIVDCAEIPESVELDVERDGGPYVAGADCETELVVAAVESVEAGTGVVDDVLEGRIEVGV